MSELTREIFKQNFPPKRVLFRVDAGRVPGVSFGHISRCLIIAKELEKSLGSETIFLMRDYTEGISFAKLYGQTVKTLAAALPKARHESLVVDSISNIKPDYLVVDLPDDDPNFYFDYARENQVFTVCIDDTAKQSYRADVILNNSILVDRDNYGLCLPNTRFLLGMEYFIMEDDIVKIPSTVNKDYVSTLITFGGSDILGLTKKTVRALAETSWPNVIFTVILGPGFRDKHSVIAASKPLQNKITIVDCPKEMKGFYLKSDLAISSGGRTLYELHKIGMPSLAIASNKNEAMVIEKFLEKRMLKFGLLKWDKQLFLEQLECAVSKILKNNVLQSSKLNRSMR